MNTDKLLMISFINQWTPLTNLLQSVPVKCMDVTEDATTFTVDESLVPSNFYTELDDTDCVYQTVTTFNTTCVRVYHK